MTIFIRYGNGFGFMGRKALNHGPCPGIRRRNVLAATSTVLLGAVAGCPAFADEDSIDDIEFERFHQTPVYLADDVELSMPEEIQTVSEPADAELIITPDEPDVPPEQAAEWLADGRILALLGDEAENTWLSWVRSDAFDEAFDIQGIAEGEPDPDLLVGVAIDQQPTRYNRTWERGPHESDILKAVDEILVDIDGRTPR